MTTCHARAIRWWLTRAAVRTTRRVPADDGLGRVARLLRRSPLREEGSPVTVLLVVATLGVVAVMAPFLLAAGGLLGLYMAAGLW